MDCISIQLLQDFDSFDNAAVVSGDNSSESHNTQHEISYNYLNRGYTDSHVRGKMEQNSRVIHSSHHSHLRGRRSNYGYKQRIGVGLGSNRVNNNSRNIQDSRSSRNSKYESNDTVSRYYRGSNGRQIDFMKVATTTLLVEKE